MTEQDVEDIRFGCETRCRSHRSLLHPLSRTCLQIRELLEIKEKADILIIAKIETMDWRAKFRKHRPSRPTGSWSPAAISGSNSRSNRTRPAKNDDPQMLSSRQARRDRDPNARIDDQNPRPTRAEASDVANAIYDSTSAVMLSGETAVGKYPIETVKVMRSIVESAESDFPYRDFFHHESRIDCQDISTAISLATVRTAYSLDAKAIFAFTSSGVTARLISRYRPEMPIIALTDNVKTYHQLAFNWGVIPVDPTPTKNAREALAITSAFAHKRNLIQHGDHVIVTTGTPFGIKGTTNSMFVECIDGKAEGND